MSALALYECMSELSSRMVTAARENNWDMLVSLEQQVASLRDRLPANDAHATLDAGERSRKVALVKRILADDAEIRRHTEPWMEQVQQFLGARHPGRVTGAYGAAANDV
jgi:flagellar protein FliT